MIERGIAALRKISPFKHLQKDIEEKQAVLVALPEAFSKFRATMVDGENPQEVTGVQALSNEYVPAKGDIILLHGKDLFLVSPIPHPEHK